MIECIASLKVPSRGFKIKSKKDAETFLSDVLRSGTLCVDVSRYFEITIEKKNGNVSVSTNYNKRSIISPSVEVPKDKQADVIFKYRKYINKQFLSD